MEGLGGVLMRLIALERPVFCCISRGWRHRMLWLWVDWDLLLVQSVLVLSKISLVGLGWDMKVDT